MTDPEIPDISTLKERLREAWRQLASPSLTAFARRELRNQMKQCSTDLRAHYQRTAERRPKPTGDSALTFGEPGFRIFS